jgi:hypothetical protein
MITVTRSKLLTASLIAIITLTSISPALAAGGYSTFSDLQNTQAQPVQYTNVPKVEQQCSPNIEKTQTGVCETPPSIFKGGVALFEGAKTALIKFVTGGFFKMITSFFTDMFAGVFSFWGDKTTIETTDRLDGKDKINTVNHAQAGILNQMEYVAVESKLNVQSLARREDNIDEVTGESKALADAGVYGAQCSIETESYYTGSAYIGSKISQITDAKKTAHAVAKGEGPLANDINRYADECPFGNMQNNSLAALNKACKDKGLEAASLQKINDNRLPGEAPYVPSTCSDTDDIDFSKLDSIRTNIDQPHKEGCPGTYARVGIEANQNKFVKNVFRNIATTPTTKTFMEESYDPETATLQADAIEYILQKSTLDALRSVALNSFHQFRAQKDAAYFPGGADQKTIMSDIDSILKESGADENKYIEYTGNKTTKPSYEAQLEFMAKLKYLNPKFTLAGMGDTKDTNNVLKTSAIENIVLYDSLKSSQRQEVLLGTVLQILMQDKQESLEELSKTLSEKYN